MEKRKAHARVSLQQVGDRVLHPTRTLQACTHPLAGWETRSLSADSRPSGEGLYTSRLHCPPNQALVMPKSLQPMQELMAQAWGKTLVMGSDLW